MLHKEQLIGYNLGIRLCNHIIHFPYQRMLVLQFKSVRSLCINIRETTFTYTKIHVDYQYKKPFLE